MKKRTKLLDKTYMPHFFVFAHSTYVNAQCTNVPNSFARVHLKDDFAWNRKIRSGRLNGSPRFIQGGE